MNEYQQAVLARLDRIAVTLDRLLFVQLANHDNRHATIPPKKALAALDKIDFLAEDIAELRRADGVTP